MKIGNKYRYLGAVSRYYGNIYTVNVADKRPGLYKLIPDGKGPSILKSTLDPDIWEKVEDIRTGFIKSKCTCGANIANSPIHSDWCDLYRGDQ